MISDGEDTDRSPEWAYLKGKHPKSVNVLLGALCASVFQRFEAPTSARIHTERLAKALDIASHHRQGNTNLR
jgi:hypothetical protein